MTNKKKHLYICNGAAYSFYDYQLDLIRSLLSKKFKVTLIQNDYFISDLFLKYINDLKQDPNFNFLIVQQLVNFSSHRSLVEITKNFSLDKPDLIILVDETTIFSRYLIRYARKNNIEIGLLQQNFLNINLLKLSKLADMKNSNLNHLNQKLKNPNYVVSKIRKNKWNKYNKKSLKELFSLINKLIIQKSKRFIFISLHYYLYPFLLEKIVFPQNNYDRYNFFSGRADFIMCQKIGDINILESFISKKSKYYLIANQKKIIKKDSDNGNSVLFLLSCIYRELDEESLSYLHEIGDFLYKNNMVKRIDLRLHPRTDPKLNWPNILKARLEKSLIKVNILRAEQEPLINVCSSYAGIVSVFSSSLKICEQNSDKFILCVLNVSGKRNFQKQEAWMLGPDPGINIIDCGENLSKSIFTRKKVIYDSIQIDTLIANKLTQINR